MPIRDLREHIDKRVRRLNRKCKDEPSAVVTHASSLIEDVCKYILESRGETTAHKLPALAKKTLSSIENWITDGISKEVIASIAVSTSTTIVKLGAVRDTASSAHGESSKQPRTPSEADAKFALHMSSSLAYYLKSLWQQTFIEKSAQELSPHERDQLSSIIRSFQSDKRFASIDRLPYSRQLIEIQTEFLLQSGVRPRLPELWRAILNLRKKGCFSNKQTSDSTKA